ncbi:MAG: asparagine synthase (glutamine-hydrolyzing) [Vicinamibacterales bacterium]
MCGIAGFVDSSRGDGAWSAEAVSDARLLVGAMCDAIRHRGPDDFGLYVADHAALGMRRLSIIDLATGHQPIANETRTVWTVFNGEIYNYRTLRTRLEGSGHRFQTATDTEVIVHGYEEWGEEVFRHLDGMFGIAIWDTRRRVLLLARDRLGIKPLHWTRTGDRLYFGSELKSLLVAPGVPRELDVDALDHYLSFLYTPPSGTIFEAIHTLRPGHLLHWCDGHSRVTPYWQLPAGETFGGTEPEAEEELRAHLAAAVDSHLMSDVPLGAFLSGGLDSGVVVALMAAHSPGPVNTFSIGFEEKAFDELDDARQVARHYGTTHREDIVRPDAVQLLDELIAHFDEPFADASAIPTYYVSRLASQHVTVVLSGDGGDELFGGYDRYLPHPRVEQFDRIASAPLRRFAGLAGRCLPAGARGKHFLRHVARDARGRYLEAVGFFGADERWALLQPALRSRRSLPLAEARLGRHFERFDGVSWPAQMMRFDSETYLPEDILTKVDRMSMAHSIESRVPLLDHHLVEFAASLPARFHIDDGQRKRLFRRVAASLLPPSLLTRPKRGFGLPLSSWLRGDLRSLFADTLLSTRARTRAYFDPAIVSRLVHEHVEGRRDHTLRLWQLIVFERWHRLYLDTGPPRQSVSTKQTTRSVAPLSSSN